MNIIELLRAAVSNSLRSKTRTTLTVLAIFIGAFTLTLTSSVGTGVNRYIDTTVASIAAGDVLTVTKTPEDTGGTGLKEYDPKQTTVAGGTGAGTAGPPTQNATVEAITTNDIDRLEAVSGVLGVEPALAVRPDYVQVGDGTKYVGSVGSINAGIRVDVSAGVEPDNAATDYQVALPTDYLDQLGFARESAAIGRTLTIAVTDATGTSTTVDATIVGVASDGIVGSASITPNTALMTRLYDTQSVGLTDTARNSYATVAVRFDEADTEAQVTTLKSNLAALGYNAATVEDQIGSFKTIIDAIVLVLNGFATIALLAAGFGIVNTLLMSVQERTREIGLMKAMGMSAGKVFTLFSFEAAFIGFLGSAIGVGIAAIVGMVGNGVLSGTLLSALPGLTLLVLNPASVVMIVLVVMSIAFLAGTIPALRAARQDPIESLRYE